MNELNAIREFGLFTVIGVIYATVITLIFTPSLFVLLQGSSQTIEQTQIQVKDNLFDGFLQRIATFDANNRIIIFVVAGLVFFISLGRMSLLRVGTEHITNFKPDS